MAAAERSLETSEALIYQWRSGKSKAEVQPASRARLPELFDSNMAGPEAVLNCGKRLARELARGVEESVRLNLARSFVAELIRMYWLTIQRRYPSPWPLPDFLSEWSAPSLTEPGASMARSMGEAAAQLNPILAGYLIGVTYTAMLSDETRSQWGVFYTPPQLASRLIAMATRAGVNWQTCRVLDPACGGGAFLGPAALEMLQGGRFANASEAVKSIGARLRGLEIDPFAAWTSQVLLEAALMETCRTAGARLPTVVQVGDSLLREPLAGEHYDLVIANPPYGRVTLTPGVRARYQRSLFGHANLYGLFTDLAAQLTGPGGVIAYVTPTSFLAGEYFKSLRRLLTEESPPVNIDFVSVRKGVFDDALQETLLAVYRRVRERRRATVFFISPAHGGELTVEAGGEFILPRNAGDPWLMPRTGEQANLIASLHSMKSRLKDYGYQVSTGPLVWNRKRKQLRDKPSEETLPLIWAESVTAQGDFVFRADKKNHKPYFEPKERDGWLISRKPCVLLQRTTAKEQNRRLIAAELPAGFLKKHGGAVVIENHLNMVLPVNGKPAVAPKVLCALLNSEIVDRAFRCLSGSVAVSAYELEALPLPSVEQLSPLQKLLERGARRDELDRACAALFGRNDT